MFDTGSIILISAPTKKKPEAPTLIVTVEDNYGFIKGAGWLLRTKEGNIVIASNSDKYIARVIFVTNKQHLMALSWLLRHPEVQNDLASFRKYLSENFANFLQWEKFKSDLSAD